MEKIYKNNHYLFIAVLLMAFVGFYKTYFEKFPSFDGISPAMHFHGIMVLCWLGMLIAQPILIVNKKMALHRQVGRASYIVMPLMVLSTVILMRLGFMRNPPPPASGPDIRLIGIADMCFFIPCYLFINVIHQEDWKAFWWMFF